MKLKRIIIFTIFIVVQFLVIINVYKKKSDFGNMSDKSKIIAKVGEYSITENEYKHYLNIYARGAKSENCYKQIIEQIKLDKILLQEAQKMKLHQNKSFMKAIEFYWQKNLKRLLINNKLKEFAQNTKIKDKEILTFYKNMGYKYVVRFSKFKNKKDALEYQNKLYYDKNLKKLKMEVFEYEDFFNKFGAIPDEKVDFIISEPDLGYWYIKIIDKEVINKKDFNKEKDYIKEIIKRKRIDYQYRNWIEFLFENYLFYCDWNEVAKL